MNRSSNADCLLERGLDGDGLTHKVQSAATLLSRSRDSDTTRPSNVSSRDAINSSGSGSDSEDEFIKLTMERKTLEDEAGDVMLNAQQLHEFQAALSTKFGPIGKLFLETNKDFMQMKEENIILEGLTEAVKEEIESKLMEWQLQYLERQRQDSVDSSEQGQNAPDDKSRLEDVIIEEGYQSDDSLEDMQENKDNWLEESEAWRNARRDLMVALETYEQTRIAIEKEKVEGKRREQEQAAVVMEKRFYYQQMRALKTSGMIHSGYTEVKESFRNDINKLESIRRENQRFISQSEALEAALSANLLSKERIFHQLKALKTKTASATTEGTKGEAQQLRKIAYERNRIVRKTKAVALSASSPMEALPLWQVAIEEATEAVAAWEQTMAALQVGMEAAALEERGWWERAMASVKHSYFAEMVTVQWYNAKRAECMARIHEQYLVQAPQNINQDWLHQTWLNALDKVKETVGAWHAVCEQFRLRMDSIDEGFAQWWMERLSASVQIEAYWTELLDAMCDFYTARFGLNPMGPASEVGVDMGIGSEDIVADDTREGANRKTSAAVSKANAGQDEHLLREASTISLASVASSGSFSTVNLSNEARATMATTLSRISSARSHLSDQRVELDDWQESESSIRISRRSIVLGVSPEQEQYEDDQHEQQIEKQRSDLWTGESREHKAEEHKRLVLQRVNQTTKYRAQIMRTHSKLLTDDMRTRQELAISSCFAEVDLARADLLQYYLSNNNRVNITILRKIAHPYTVGNAAVKQYTDMVRLEAINDSRMSSAEARIRREDWQRRIAADARVVEETKDLRNQAAAGSDMLEKIRTRRDHLRAKAIHNADQSAYAMAWVLPSR
jgi:hypothetical protein